MAITNYGELKSAVSEWLAKSNLAPRAADFISLASTRIFYGSGGSADSNPVRTFELQAQEAPVPVSRVIALPTRYLETISLAANNGSSSWTLDYVSTATMREYDNYTGYPSLYTIVNGGILVNGTISVTFTHDFYREPVAFSSDTDTHPLLTKAPGLWLYGACLEAAIYQKDEMAAAQMLGLYKGVADAINNQVKWAGGGTLAMRKR